MKVGAHAFVKKMDYINENKSVMCIIKNLMHRLYIRSSAPSILSLDRFFVSIEF